MKAGIHRQILDIELLKSLQKVFWSHHRGSKKSSFFLAGFFGNPAFETTILVRRLQ